MKKKLLLLLLLFCYSCQCAKIHWVQSNKTCQNWSRSIIGPNRTASYSRTLTTKQLKAHSCFRHFFPPCPSVVLHGLNTDFHHLCRAVQTHWDSTSVFVSLIIIIPYSWVAAMIDFFVPLIIHTFLIEESFSSKKGHIFFKFK